MIEPQPSDDMVVGDDAALDEFLADLETPLEEGPERHHQVLAILVSRQGEVWLPQVLTALADQERQPDHYMAVTTEGDPGRDLLVRAFGADRVIDTDPEAGFGGAVAGAVDVAERQAPQSGESAGEVTRWVWLLHDDCAVAPDTLRQLLLAGDRRPEAGVIGPKVLGWKDPRMLISVGLSISASGRLVSGLAPYEFDAGQHDGDREVLAVGTAGMLIRRDVWEALRGFDPDVPLFRDDVAFCMRAHRAGFSVLLATDAHVRHRQAGANGRRRITTSPLSAARLAREADGYVSLVHGRGLTLPVRVLVFVAACIGRSVALALGRDRQAVDEFAAMVGVLRHPGRVRRGRKLVKSTTIYPPSHLRHLRARPGAQFVEARQRSAPQSAAPSPTEMDTAFDSSAALELEDVPWLERQVRRPAVILVAALSVAAFAAYWGLWRGPGVLQGGALLPVDESSLGLWSSYLSGWHDVGLGSDAPAWPYLAPLSILSSLMLSADRAITTVLLLAVPAAGASAYLSLRGLLRRSGPRAFAAGTYALAPAIAAAGSTGRLGTCAFAIVLPVLARQMIIVCWPRKRHRVTGAPVWLGNLEASGFEVVRESIADKILDKRRVWFVALLLTLASAFVPAVWTVAAAALLVSLASRRVGLGVAFVILAVPVVLLLPWSWEVVRHPGLLLLEPGLAGHYVGAAGVDVVDLMLADPDGPGSAPAWPGAVLLLAGLVALSRRSRLIFSGMVAAAFGLLWGLIYLFVPVVPPAVGHATYGWPGPATLLVVGGLAFAVARWAEESLADGRQLRILVAFAVLAPAAWGISWVVGSPSDEVTRTDASRVPAIAVADSASADRSRTLILRRGEDSRIDFALVGGSQVPMGMGELPMPRYAASSLEHVVEDLAAARADDEVDRLAQMAVRYVVLADPEDQQLVRSLDSEPGLRRIAASDGLLWRVNGGAVRARLQTSVGAGVEEVAIPALADGVSAQIPPDQPGALRRVIFAVSASPGWKATLDGRPLASARVPGAPDGWAVAFALPDAGGHLEIRFDNTRRWASVAAQVLACIAVVVLALPRRRHEEDPDEADVIGLDPVVAELPVRDSVVLP